MNVPERINRALGRITGFELRRTGPSPTSTAPTRSPAPKEFASAPPTERPAAKRKPRKRAWRALPPARLPLGAAKASMFFDRHPGLGARQQHMNLRHQAIIAQNQHVLDGATVLDVGCSEGAWALAALDAGAAHVIGIEARPDKVENANEHFRHYGVDPSRYQFIAGDVFEVLERQAPQADVVLCLGFLYHTLRYPELLHHIRSTNARYLIIDTEVANTPAPVVRLVAENVDSTGNATQDQFSTNWSVLSGRPSLNAIRKMLRVYGYEVESRSDWAAILRDNAGIDIDFPVYAQGRRVTVLCRRVEALGWQDRGVSRF